MSEGTVWTMEMNSALIGLLEDPNLSYKAVAAAMSAKFGLSITKNACIGKARRLGVAMRDLTQRQPIVGKQPTISVKKVRVDAPIAPRIPHRLKPDHVTIYQLSNTNCKWPLGPPLAAPPFLYCGRAAEDGASYCPEHCARAYNRPGKTWA